MATAFAILGTPLDPSSPAPSPFSLGVFVSTARSTLRATGRRGGPLWTSGSASRSPHTPSNPMRGAHPNPMALAILRRSASETSCMTPATATPTCCATAQQASQHSKAAHIQLQLGRGHSLRYHQQLHAPVSLADPSSGRRISLEDQRGVVPSKAKVIRDGNLERGF